MLKTQVIEACRAMLAPVVRILLRNGVSWREFAELGKEVYVDVARRDYGVQGRPTNLARVSMITGMSRREVTRLRDILEGDLEQAEPAPSRISTILSAWHLDPEFLNDGAPAVLAEQGRSGSLEALLDRYAGDLPHGALRKELLQLGLIVQEGNGYRVLQRDYVRRAADPDMLRQAAVALRDHGTTLAFNVDAERSEPPRFERMVTLSNLDRRHLEAFHAYVEERGQAFLEELDGWLSAHAIENTDNGKYEVRAGLGMYLIQDDS